MSGFAGQLRQLQLAGLLRRYKLSPLLLHIPESCVEPSHAFDCALQDSGKLLALGAGSLQARLELSGLATGLLHLGLQSLELLLLARQLSTGGVQIAVQLLFLLVGGLYVKSHPLHLDLHALKLLCAGFELLREAVPCSLHLLALELCLLQARSGLFLRLCGSLHLLPPSHRRLSEFSQPCLQRLSLPGQAKAFQLYLEMLLPDLLRLRFRPL
mmetsp:Transcript_71918/g.181472  ORF Transcript_71918/g.181472 Transcript_71918/m.181472 type:complete len:213 (+) Transcript_71918:1302-1940(+)